MGSHMPSKLPGDKEIMRLKMLCEVMLTKITVANHGCSWGDFPVLLAAQLILVMILNTLPRKTFGFN